MGKKKKKKWDSVWIIKKGETEREWNDLRVTKVLFTFTTLEIYLRSFTMSSVERRRRVLPSPIHPPSGPRQPHLIKKFKNNTRKLGIKQGCLFLPFPLNNRKCSQKGTNSFLKFKFGFDSDGHWLEAMMGVIPYTVVPKASFTKVQVNCVKANRNKITKKEQSNSKKFSLQIPSCVSKQQFSESPMSNRVIHWLV